MSSVAPGIRSCPRSASHCTEPCHPWMLPVPRVPCLWLGVACPGGGWGVLDPSNAADKGLQPLSRPPMDPGPRLKRGRALCTALRDDRPPADPSRGPLRLVHFGRSWGMGPSEAFPDSMWPRFTMAAVLTARGLLGRMPHCPMWRSNALWSALWALDQKLFGGSLGGVRGRPVQ